MEKLSAAAAAHTHQEVELVFLNKKF